MTETQNLEEAWKLVAEAGNLIVAATPDGQFVGLHTAVRALALAVLEEALAAGIWSPSKIRKLRRRIKELGR